MSTPNKRLNILIYSGPGSTPTSIRHATWTLRRLLGSAYAVLPITSDQLLKEPWQPTCALLVMPGGADLAYCRLLNGEGNRRIKQFVQGGGSYLGLCAGGYYGCAKCEFELGRKGMEVVGERELAFFPGVCRGLAFPGFVYGSEAGAKAVTVEADGSAFGKHGDIALQGNFRSYYNGGGVFVDAGKFKDRGVETLATYGDELAVEGGEAGAAVVYCKVGEGHVVLTGPHPEFAAVNLDREQKTNPDYGALVDALTEDDKARTAFMRACLSKLWLEVSEEVTPVPSLSHLHLSSIQPQSVTELLQSWHENGVIVKSDDGQGTESIRGENDTFILEPQDSKRWSMGSLAEAVRKTVPKTVQDAIPSSSANSSTNEIKAEAQTDFSSGDRILDYNAVMKYVVPHEDTLPDGKETPYFNHGAFFSNLKAFQDKHRRESEAQWGNTLLYGEVVTSTNTLLEKNTSWLSHIPSGFTATATTQVAGRGRGSNVWVSPPGSLMFSTVFRHSLALSNSAPVVFVQYLAALAIVAGIKGYGRGYEKLPVRLKWPNDIYALDPSQDKNDAFVKIGGILVNSSYAGGGYTLVVGIGMNVNNLRPSASLSQLAKKVGLEPFTLEKLLASILIHFEELYTRFCRTGFDARIEKDYYDSWLHTDQIVTLETEGGAQARIKGITRNWGLLVAEELSGAGNRPTGRKWELQSDSNSFDFFKGLLKRKT